MISKKLLISLITFFSATNTQSFTVDPAPYQKQAQSWAKKYIYDNDNIPKISSLDLQLIANLCYFSFERSNSTLKGQEQSLKTLSTIWSGWQNITQTRLNPSITRPHEILEIDKTNSIENFWTAHDEQQMFGQAYAHSVETIVNGNELESASALKAIQEMRSKARSIIAKALIDVRKKLGTFLISLANKQKKNPFTWISHLWNYVPQLAIKSFVQAEALNNKVSDESWNAVLKMQQFGVLTWEEIEQARASFYLAYYQEIISILNKTDKTGNYKTIIFDQHGKNHTIDEHLPQFEL